MSKYIVSARKYRPDSFHTVVGQSHLTHTLRNAIDSGKLAHAYLFSGPRGVGKTTLARIYAKAINCFHRTPEGEACNECESCKAFNEQRSMNIYELDAASNNRVEDIRSLIEEVWIPPQLGQYKVYIIDEVHMLSQSAFNAFLKTLEEPPHHAIFILATTEKHKILPTIISRCQVYDFSRISQQDIVDQLKRVSDREGITYEEEALHLIASKADGGMRDALSIFDQVVGFSGGNLTYTSVLSNLNILDVEYYLRLTSACLGGKYVDALLVYDDLLARGFDGQIIIQGLASFLRNVLMAKDASTVNLLDESAPMKKKYADMAQQSPAPFLFQAISLLVDTDKEYRASNNKRLLAELTLMKISNLIRPFSSDTDKSSELTSVPIPSVKEVSPSSSSPSAVAEDRNISSDTTARTSPSHIGESKIETSTQAKKRKIGALSIKEALRNNSTKYKAKEDILKENIPFTLDELCEAWKEYAETKTGEQIILRNAMLETVPKLVEPGVFSVEVLNPGQENKLNEARSDIMDFISLKLHNGNIAMEIEIREIEEGRKLYTVKEKYDYIMENYPEASKLRDSLDLIPE